MARTVLEVFFKKYRDAIQSNKSYRDELNKKAVHYLEEDLDAIKNQISTISAQAEIQFNKKYAQALEAIAQKGISDVTFSKIADSVKKTFLSNFTELKELGVDIGHVQSNLTIASKGKAQTELFEQDLPLRRNNIDQLTDQDLKDISKTIALIVTYTETLEELDKVQTRSQLLKFLKKSQSFKNIARGSDVTTLEGIKDVVKKAFSYQGSKGFSDLGREILNQQILSVKVDTTVNLKRKITASPEKIGVTFEIAAFNRLKGTVAKEIQGNFTQYLDSLMKDPQGLSKELNQALNSVLQETLTQEDLQKLFPNVYNSKSFIEYVDESISDALKGIKSKKYGAQRAVKGNNETSAIDLKIPKLAIKLPKVKSSPNILRTKKGEFFSLTALRGLLDAQLVQRVKENMGYGNRRDILNLRTGRFAESVKIENISQSREGMITAFYNYMRNPYATFSSGGKQQYPKTRDPKLLISKSIREIAQSKVQNRLRAVLV